MQKWEYATVPLLVHATKQILDNWGDDGWELVAVVPGPNTEQLVTMGKAMFQGAMTIPAASPVQASYVDSIRQLADVMRQSPPPKIT